MDTKRSRVFQEDNNLSGGRYAWYKRYGNYVPPIYSFLTDDEWMIMEKWYEDTEKAKLIGESNVPFMSLLQGFIMGNSLTNIVQLGHYAGYSALLIGFMLRKMGKKHSFVSIDIDKSVSNYTQSWIKRAGLQDYVSIITGNSSDQSIARSATKSLNDVIQAIIIDSSHQYAQTLSELDLWYPLVQDKGFIFMHDVSEFATRLDSTNKGGVKNALQDWIVGKPEIRLISIDQECSNTEPAYKDPCGIGIIQKVS